MDRKWHLQPAVMQTLKLVKIRTGYDRKAVFHDKTGHVCGCHALMERGLLDPGAFVEEFLPGFHNAIVASGGKLVPTVRPVRICDLLNMTSGLMYGGDVTSVCSMETEKLFDRIKEHLYLEDAMTTQEVANRLGLIPLQFQPGESFQYGTSADVLGAVIEVISGKTFGEFLKEEFLNHLTWKILHFMYQRTSRSALQKYTRGRNRD